MSIFEGNAPNVYAISATERHFSHDKDYSGYYYDEIFAQLVEIADGYIVAGTEVNWYEKTPRSMLDWD